MQLITGVGRAEMSHITILQCQNIHSIQGGGGGGGCSEPNICEKKSGGGEEGGGGRVG